MDPNKILRRDHTLTEEFHEIKTMNIEGIEFSFKVLYYLDYEDTSKINKEKQAKYCTSQQMNQNLEAFKISYLKAKAGVFCDDLRSSTPAEKDDFLRVGWETSAKQAHENGDDEMLMDMCDTNYNLNELLKDVSDDRIHPEINTGDSQGGEVC